MSQIKIYLFCESKLVCDGVVKLLATTKGVKCTGLSSVSEDAVKDVLRLKPDILLVSSEIYLKNTEKIRLIDDKLALKIIVFNVPAESLEEKDVVCSGVHGILYREDSFDLLIKAIKVVQDGDFWIRRKVLQSFLNNPKKTFDDTVIFKKVADKGLTNRELEILGTVTKGLSNCDIASELCISEKTVKTHLSSIFKKLNVSSRTQAILFLN
ncbi:MAG: response regulator transcription factor [Deltaproteobacteria bacterium]|nr:response regulator transcription factor [Deltaproteobacteria bacterium]